ncbi:hypothetical protein BJV82DRAFT_412199 [Fennellomyces sp. T-0311]|nr:hypothetical protein BJV82DRAFT_412199 [Fennellomyces sp. T-0311]
MSNIACRIMRFNYSAQAQFPGAFRSNAAVTSVDNWMCSESNDLEERLPQSIDCGDTRKRLNVLEALYFLSNLIQAHKPYMHLDANTKSFSARPSFEICYLTAIMISHITHTMPITELADLCKSPPTLYAIVKALQVHLENATQSESERVVAFSEISFERTMTKLWILPTISRQKDDSMLTETLHYLEQKYYQRSNIVVGSHSPSRNADSPAPTLSSNGTSAMSVSSAEGTPPNGSVQGSIPPSNIQQPYDWSPITFVNMNPQGKTSLGKRRSREPSKRSPPKPPLPQDQNNILQTPASSTAASVTDINIQHYQIPDNQQSYSFIPSVNTSAGYPQQLVQQQVLQQQQRQQQQQQQQQQQEPLQQLFHGQQQIVQTEMNAVIGAGFDLRSMLYPGTTLMPPTPVEQDPDLPSLILSDDQWNLQNNYT